jgi:beta-hexosaminidase (fragment)
VEHEGLADSHELQLWLSTRMAAHLASKGRKAVFWEDVVHNTGPRLPDNAVIQWWNYRGHGNDAVHKAKSLGLPVVLSPNYYCYLNFPETPWRGYENDRTFDLADAYLRNPAHTEISRDNPLLMGITAALWTDYGLTDDMIDNRIFPRIFALAELMWHQGELMTLNQLTHKITCISAYFSRQGFVW